MINRNTCQNIRDDFAEAVKAMEQRYGVTFNLGNMRFSSSEISVKLNIRAKTMGGVSFEEAQFKQFAGRYGLKPEHLGKTVTVQLSKYQTMQGTIVGLNSKSRKYPVIVQTAKGKRYKMGALKVKQMLGEA